MTSYVGNDHSSYPYSAVTYIESTFPNGQTYIGSGAVVGKNDVLTASHLIYSPSDGGLAEDIDVYPGRDGSDITFGSYDAEYVNYFEVDQDGDGLLTRAESEYDFALLGFDTVFGDDTGWFELDPYGTSGNYNLTGYPDMYSGKTGPRMINDFGYVSQSTYSNVFDLSTIEVDSGASGGPLWYSENTGASIVGVLSTSGWAGDVYDQYPNIVDWIEGNNNLLYKEENIMDITFKEDPSSSATFKDLFTDDAEKATWYRLSTGDEDGNWSYVDTSAFNNSGNGWIEKEDLEDLDIDFAQANDSILWVQPWSNSEGLGDWVEGSVDFSNPTEDDITTQISEDTPMDQMFVDEDTSTDTWYQIWIGNAQGTQGSYLNTSYGNGWVKEENLRDYTFDLEDAGNDLWVQTWSDGVTYNWEHWTVEQGAGDDYEPEFGFDIIEETNSIDTSGYDYGNYNNIINDILSLPNAEAGLLEPNEVQQAYLHIDQGEDFEFDYDTFVLYDLDAGTDYRIKLTAENPSYFQSNQMADAYDPSGEWEAGIMNLIDGFSDGSLYSDTFTAQEDGDHYLQLSMRWDVGIGEYADGPEPYDIELIKMNNVFNASTDDQQIETLGISNEGVQNEVDLV